MMSYAARCGSLVLACVALAASARADSPFGKTFVGSAEACIVRSGTCTGTVPIHVFLAKSGRLYSFLRSEGGEVFPLGQFRSFGNTQQRFLISGNTLVYEDVFPDQSATVTLRGTLRAQGGACSVSATATSNGHPEPITFSGSCAVYDGQH